MAVAGPVWAVRTVTVPCSRQGPYRDTPTRSGGSKPQATVDRSEPRHSSQLHCGSDHDLGRHVGDHHGQTTTWGRYTPILTVALSDRLTPLLHSLTQKPWERPSDVRFIGSPILTGQLDSARLNEGGP